MPQLRATEAKSHRVQKPHGLRLGSGKNNLNALPQALLHEIAERIGTCGVEKWDQPQPQDKNLGTLPDAAKGFEKFTRDPKKNGPVIRKTSTPLGNAARWLSSS